MCELCDKEPIKHQCKGDCNKHVCDDCIYNCVGDGCNNVVCYECHDVRMQKRIRPEKIHYYCNGCLRRHDMG